MTATILASRYRLGALLGAGGMGAVYQAEDLEHGREVAVKLVRPELAGDAAARGYLDAEVRMTGRVVHRNVVALLAAGETERHEPYVVMELVRGRSLRDVVRAAGPLAPRRACSIVQQVLAGLEAIHAAGFVHGDVKSENVLIDESGRALLIDLGLSRRHSEVPGDGFTSGTPEYMAPEVIRGRGAVVESDLYAVGILLYELLTGETPFAGGSSIEVLCRHLDDLVVPASLRRPGDIPRALEDVLQRALEKTPRMRFPSAAAFGRALALATAPVVVARRFASGTLPPA